MELIYEIAEYFDIPNEYVHIDKVIGTDVWFSIKGGTSYSCSTWRNGKHMKKNSIRYA